jgi:GT2 family glycosyltransferase
MTNRIAVLITSFNRKDKTLAAIRGVYSQQLPVGKSCTVFLLDDNSGDGTAAAVKIEFPAVRLMSGDGARFWNGGMRIAYAEAQKEDFDFYVFLNDDSELWKDALQRLLETSAELQADGKSKAIVVGSLQDPNTGETTYGGLVRVNPWRKLNFTRLSPDLKRKECETFNANLVLIPREVTQRLGNLSNSFQHAMGDFDYGLRAWKHGCSVWVAPGYFGTCSRNSAGRAEDSTLPFRERWKAFCGLKGLPPKQWRVLARRHAGPFWAIYFASPYVQFAVKCLLRKLISRSAAAQNAAGRRR